MTDELFYLRDTRSNVGSSALFWDLGGGYTSSLARAQKFTREQAVGHHNARETDVPLRCDLVDPLSYLAVDMQHLRHALKPTGGLVYMVTNCEYDGNNVLFLAEAGMTHDVSAAALVEWQKALKIQRSSNVKVEIYAESDIRAVARPVVHADDVPTGKFLRKAKIKMNRLARPKRPTTGKHRGNCPVCGKITWDYNPYENATCRMCYL